MYAHRNSSSAFTEKFCNPQIRLSASPWLSVETAEPPLPKSNLALVRLPTANRHITAAVHNWHTAGGPTKGVRRPSAHATRTTDTPHTFDVQTALKWASQVYKQTDVAGPAHILICNPRVSTGTRQARTGNPLLPFSGTVLCCPAASKHTTGTNCAPVNSLHLYIGYGAAIGGGCLA